MADEFDSEGQDELRDDLLGEEAEDRACAFCGAAIHPSSHRCPECGGHVGLAWGTVHREQFLFLFAACCMAVGCLVSWDQTRPSDFNGLQTIRGAMILAFSLYGLIAGVVAIFNRRTLIWPFFLGAIEALWVGIEGITGSIGSAKWEEYARMGGQPWWGKFRAIPPGFWLLTLGGALVVIAVLKGVVGGFAGAKAKAKVTASGRATTASERRRTRLAAAGSPTAPVPFAGGVDPTTGEPIPPPPPPI
jgi:hypothetical protein